MSPGRPDPTLVRRHLLALQGAIRNLRRHAGRPLTALTQDVDEAWAVEHGLQVCAQNTLDVATHLAAAAGHDCPDYAAAIDALAVLGVLPTEFAARLRPIAGFRNLLVHGYLEVDLVRLHEILNGRLDDLEEYANLVEAHLGA